MLQAVVYSLDCGTQLINHNVKSEKKKGWLFPSINGFVFFFLLYIYFYRNETLCNPVGLLRKSIPRALVNLGSTIYECRRNESSVGTCKHTLKGPWKFPPFAAPNLHVLPRFD